MPNRWQAIVWANEDPHHWRIHVSPDPSLLSYIVDAIQGDLFEKSHLQNVGHFVQVSMRYMQRAKADKVSTYNQNVASVHLIIRLVR